MSGNLHIHAQLHKIKARRNMRAFLHAFTMIEMMVAIIFLSMFSFQLRIFIKDEPVVLETVLLYKKKLDVYPFTCVKRIGVINMKSDPKLACTSFASYVRFEYEGYIFYARRR